MKTVMKKMFSLLLVAVLLVGAMPFQAFADGETSTKHCNACGQDGHSDSDAHCSVCKWYIGHDEDCTSGCDETSTCSWNKQHKATCLTRAVCEHCGATGQHFSNNCPDYCTKCSQDGHDESEAHCSVCGWYVGHNHDTCTYGCTGTSSCTWEHVHKTGCISLTKCEICKAEGQHATENCPYKEKTCSKCQRTYKDIDGAHVCCDVCKELHATANCPYCATCWARGDQVKTHSTSAHCTECDTVNGHTSGCSNYQYPQSGSYTVSVWGNLITGETKTERIWLGKIENVAGTALVRDVIGANKEYLLGQIAWKAPGYGWSTNYYAENSSGKLIEIGSNTTVEAEDDIIINLYAEQKLVVVRVHTDKSYHVDMTVQVNGFKVNDVVTYDDVLKAVKKHYNVSSMKIYTYTEWEKVINGKDANKTTSFVVKGGSNDNVYEVYLTGSVKSSSSSSSATADSSNPKTGDMIFAPVAVMGLSVSALAVLFFLNKKRAY